MLHFLIPGSHLLSSPWTFLGLIPFLIGLGINLLADNAFKGHGTTVKPFEESTALVTTGIFRFTRNPMLLGSLTPWIVIVVFIFVMEIIFIRVEEKMLEEKFGQAFSEYKRKVRRWI
ncbi:MAG: isoprenylcysteine carboxylmethyltransferase family protein [Anaerolineae bacterium]|nr:isoprenylcysteine carboxylmethyltransferase family protein [Anaerolineae bacterium]